MFLINSRYRLCRQLDHHVEGFVDYMATDTLNQRQVVLRLSINEDATSHQRLIAMAHFLRQLNSTSIANVLDCGLDLTHHPQTMGYLVMEFVEGYRLDRYLERFGPVCDEDISKILVGLISGLEHAHKQGIFHGNLKTKNIWLKKQFGQYHIKIAGFGESMDWSQPRPTYTRFTPDFGAPLTVYLRIIPLAHTPMCMPWD